MASLDGPVSAHLSRVASILADNLHSTSQLAELRTAVSAAISNYNSAHMKHGYLEPMLEAAANVWNASLALADADQATDATLKQASLDLQWSAFENPTKLPLTHQLRLAEHAFTAAEIWGELEEWEAVDAALGRGLALSSVLSSAATAPGGAPAASFENSTQERCALVLFNSLLLRLRASVRLGQELPANGLLLKLKQLTSQASIPFRQRTMFSLDLLATLVFEGEHLLEVTTSKLAVQITQAAYNAYTSLTSATPELQTVGLAEDAQNLGARALILLCWAQIGLQHGSLDNSKNAAAADDSMILKCIAALQKHSARTADSVAVHFLAHQALQQAGRMQEAETELLKLVTHESATAETCAFAIKSALLVPGGAESARAALAAAQDLTSADDISLIMELIEAVLGSPSSSSQSHGRGTTAAAGSTPGAASPTAADEVILDLLEDESLKESLENDPKSMQKLHILCWNRGCSLLEADEPEWAKKFFTVALLFIDSEKDKDIVLQSQMALCVCSNTQGKYSEAMEHLKTCPDESIEVKFLILQTCLAANDAAAASAALKSLAEHPECDADMLRVLCCEALDAGLTSAAKDALYLLLEKLQSNEKNAREQRKELALEAAPLPGMKGDLENSNINKNTKNNQFSAGYEAVVFQNLIQLELDAHATKAALFQGGKEGEVASAEVAKSHSTNADRAIDATNSPWEQLATIYESLVKRVTAVGVEHFFQNEEGGTWSQLEWMLLTAWNAGYDAGRGATNSKVSGRLMACCGHLCAAHPSPTADTLNKQQAAFTLAAAGIIEFASDGSQAAPAAEFLKQASRAAARLALGNDKTQVYIHVLEFALAVKQCDLEAALAAVQRAKGLPTATAEHFLKMAAFLEEQEMTHPFSSARKIAMKIALERLTSQPELNYAAVAGVIRSLLEACSNDVDRLTTLQDAAGLISAAPSPTAGTAGYPPLEVRYLITAAWNRGATHSKFARMKDAEAFMGVALRILSAFSFTENKTEQHAGFSAEEKKMMSEEYARVQAAAGTGGGNGDGQPAGTESMEMNVD